MNPPGSGTFALPGATAGQTSARPGLHARCARCGTAASDWRHLLGIGASVAVGTADSQGMLLTYPGACGRCGAPTLLVETRLLERTSILV
jgi:hypothetical protein